MSDPAFTPAEVAPTEDARRLRVRWRDGHATGIYPFRLLRELCPCAECAGGAA